MSNQPAPLRIGVVDLNGQWRGKRLPQEFANKTNRMPLSALNVDIFGADIENSPLLFATGDRDGVLHPTDRGPVPMPWLDQPGHLIPQWMYREDGQPFAGDSRHCLAQILDKYEQKGWTVQAATELEFYLARDIQLSAPASAALYPSDNILSLAELDHFESFFNDLYSGCQAMDIPAQAAMSECGTGQFEVNLIHRDAMQTADNTLLFKTLAKGLARKHGLIATFMAKPFEQDAGNGLHVHFSVLNQSGENIFDDGSAMGNNLLKHAIGGCLQAMAPSTLFFAPHQNSYDRFVDASHAPTAACWGYDNRTVALRIPAGPPNARRIEHRVAGGDVNPYLMLAAILGAAFIGIEDRTDPPAPITGNAYAQDLPGLHTDWQSAIRALEDQFLARIFPQQLLDNLHRTKLQEVRKFADLSAQDRLLAVVEAV
ncbi:glutamine synthetase family protein [Pseudaestuariivita rosea]|uniref:glutamine synthetase family protein n=1 Tax=Pseudaestuariivita rosea TaxID=2763263 RepID=UPI001ABB4753|nr:glutamine synthetase family protein [Pseudaestuariivita rosea]